MTESERNEFLKALENEEHLRLMDAWLLEKENKYAKAACTDFTRFP